MGKSTRLWPLKNLWLYKYFTKQCPIQNNLILMCQDIFKTIDLWTVRVCHFGPCFVTFLIGESTSKTGIFSCSLSSGKVPIQNMLIIIIVKYSANYSKINMVCNITGNLILLFTSNLNASFFSFVEKQKWWV